MVFLELRRDSRVTTGNSGCRLCWPREVQSSIRVAKESWGLLSSDCRADRPHLGLCPEAEVPLQGRPVSRGGIPDAPGETGIHLEWKQRTPLCSRVAPAFINLGYVSVISNNNLRRISDSQYILVFYAFIMTKERNSFLEQS